MRRVIAIVVTALVLAGCRSLYMSDYANILTRPDALPPVGVGGQTLTDWFDRHDYVTGPKVLQSEAELRRRPRAPLVYSLPGDRLWWLTAHRVVQHVCATRHVIYYRLDADGALAHVIGTYHNHC